MDAETLFVVLSMAAEERHNKQASGTEGGYGWGDFMQSPEAMTGLGALAGAGMTAFSDADYEIGPDGRPRKKSKPWLRNTLSGAAAGLGASIGLPWLKYWLAKKFGQGGVGGPVDVGSEAEGTDGISLGLKGFDPESTLRDIPRKDETPSGALPDDMASRQAHFAAQGVDSGFEPPSGALPDDMASRQAHFAAQGRDYK